MSWPQLWFPKLPTGGIPTDNRRWQELVDKSRAKLDLFHYEESEDIAASMGVGDNTVGSRSKMEFTLENERYMIARDYIDYPDFPKTDVIHCFLMNPDYTWKLLPDDFLEKIKEKISLG
ncbi:MAG: hypothetical protein P4L74_06795 [Candidatus Doudnabacteria bacterium]|nr:hypothetical protein [Candidatus Doudnabacteria bacterium]